MLRKCASAPAASWLAGTGAAARTALAPEASISAARRVTDRMVFTAGPGDSTRHHRSAAPRIQPHRSAQIEFAHAHGLQIGGEVAPGGFDENLLARRAGIDPVRPEIAEVATQPAPRAQRPLAAPERQAQRLDLAHAGAAVLVAVG